MRVTLTVTAGLNQGQVFLFEQHDLFLVGRSPEAHFCLADDPYFSRLHFMVEVNPPLCRIVDLRSRNGTLVNGSKLQQPCDLQNGDEIEGGKTRLRVLLALPSQQPPATLALAAPVVAAGESPAPSSSSLSRELSLPFPMAGLLGSDSSSANKSGSHETPIPASDLPTAPPGQAGPVFPAIAGYRIVEKVGEGGMGVVYKAQRESDGLIVAIKTIRPAVVPDEATVARFLREADILRQLQHPHIVAFTEMGQAGKLLFFAMEFVPGCNLADVRSSHVGLFPVGRAVRLVCRMLEALAYAHSRGFVHRDIKPGNVLVAETADGETVKLADFGLARTYQTSKLSGLTMTGEAGGTPQFMPPEQVLDFRSVKPAADQYATAATLYFLLTGQTLYPGKGKALDVLLQVLQGQPQPVEKLRPDLPAALATAIGRGPRHKPEERFADVGQVNSVVFSGDGKRIIRGGQDMTVKVWNAGRQVETGNRR